MQWIGYAASKLRKLVERLASKPLSKIHLLPVEFPHRTVADMATLIAPQVDEDKLQQDLNAPEVKGTGAGDCGSSVPRCFPKRGEGEPAASTQWWVLLVQLLMGVVFFSHCYRVIATKADALAAFPTDQEVAELDAKNAQFEKVVAEVGDFKLAPPFVRYLFVSGMALSVLSMYALVLAGSTLFQAFKITDCIEDLGRVPTRVVNGIEEPDAEWYENFVIPVLGIKVLGFVMILFILYGLFTLKYFQRWQTRQAERRIADGAHDAASPANAL